METTTLTTVTVPITAGDNPETVPTLAEKTVTPGLAIIPEYGSFGMTGAWMLIHARSGCQIPVVSDAGVDLYTAHRVAAALATVEVDWTADKETIGRQLADESLKKAVADAIARGKYPPPDRGADHAGSDPNGWPDTVDQVTARWLARSFTESALQRNADSSELAGYASDDTKGRAVFTANCSAMIAEFGVVHLLRALAAINPAAADHAAREFWEACDAGDSFGEVLAEWGLEYGIPVPTAQDKNPGLTTSPPQAAAASKTTAG